MALPLIENNSVWNLPPPAEKVFTIRISRKAMLALAVSILLHLILLWFFAPKLLSMGAPVKQAPPFEITLGPPQEKKTASLEPSPPQPVEPTKSEPTKSEPSKSRPKKVMKEKSVPPKQVKTVEEEKKSEFVLPKALDKKLPAPPAPKPIDTAPLPGEDMQAYIRRMKEARLAQQGASKQDVEEVLASSNPPSEGQKRDAKIRENLKFDGTNGIFEIREMGLHHARFSFKGWKNSMSNAKLEIIDVEIPDGSDGKHEVITKMIEIIRREYNGDFNWDSWRQQRVLVLSARVEDTAALESFLMGEIAWPR